jgi:2,5-furandicarboxylate decarboxylase 1
VEWAIATRVQGDRDVIIIPGARAKPLDPSLAVTPPGVVPTGAKVGIDATIGEGIPRERFERIAYAYADSAKIADYVKGKADKSPATAAGDDRAVAALAEKIREAIEAAPLYYSEIAEQFSDYNFQTVARALGKLHADEKLWQDPRGRMCLRGSAFAAKPPMKPS